MLWFRVADSPDRAHKKAQEPHVAGIKTIQSSHVILLELPAVRQSIQDMWLGFVILDGLAEIPHVVLFELKIPSDPKSTMVLFVSTT